MSDTIGYQNGRLPTSNVTVVDGTGEQGGDASPPAGGAMDRCPTSKEAAAAEAREGSAQGGEEFRISQ